MDNRDRWTKIYEAVAEAVIDAMNVSTLTCVTTLKKQLDKNTTMDTYLYDEPTKHLRPFDQKMQKPALVAVHSEWLSNLYEILFKMNTPTAVRLRVALSRRIALGVSMAVNREDPVQKHKRLAALHDLWMAVLLQISPVIASHFDEGTDGSSAPSITTTSTDSISQLPPHQSMYVAVMEAYAHIAIGPYPKTAPTLVRPAMSDCCFDCLEVNKFLGDGSQRDLHIPLNKQRRFHIHQRLQEFNVDCTHESLRHTNPHTLVITKTTKLFDNARKDWTLRKAEVDRYVRRFPQGYLQTILGPYHDRVIYMEKLMGGVVLPRPPAPAQVQPQAKRVRTDQAPPVAAALVPSISSLPGSDWSSTPTATAGPSRRTPPPNGESEPVSLLTSPLRAWYEAKGRNRRC